ncbi:MAG: right-handed parallel beta-helix repeat-containing protein [Thermoplasmata archaeon]|nr:MAG: right-handed parallel beta-helix repeat-containing protein [Thermoplasmata archaeon]
MVSFDRKTHLPALLLLVFMAVISLVAISTAASTDVSGDISSSTTWTVSGSPYYIKSNVVVQDGVTLTIDPGVEVKFTGKYYLECGATGRILALGTEEDRINFTSDSDTPTTDDWSHLGTGSAGKLENCLIMHASIAVKVNNGGTVSGCDIRGCTTGFLIQSTGATVKDTYIFGTLVGIGLDGANNAVIEGNVVQNCDQGINFLGTTRSSLVDRCFINASSEHGIGIVASGGGNKVWNSHIALSPTGILMMDLMAPTAMGDVHLFNNTIEAFSQKGISLDAVYPVNGVKIQRCRVWDGNLGLYINNSARVEVTECTFREDIRNVRVLDTPGYNSYIHKNNFLKPSIIEAESTNSEVLWDKDGFGNFWWRAVFEYGFTDNNGDGIADREWSITGTQKDNFPLMKPVDFLDPMAEAGRDKTVSQGIPFELDGRDSTDDTWIANYTWTIEVPDGDDIVLYGNKVDSIIVDVAGVFTVTLLVTDPLGNTDTDTMTLTIRDREKPRITAFNIPAKAGAGTTFVFSVNITDNIGVVDAWVTYWFGLVGKHNRLDLEHKGNDVWENETYIPVTITQKMYYTITALDNEKNRFVSAQKEVPVVDITPPTMERSFGDNVTTGDLNWINMTITDNRQVDWASMEYWYGEDGEHLTVNLTMMGMLWVTELDVPRDAPSPMFVVFTSVDLAGNVNVSDPLEVTVVDNDAPIVNIDMTTNRLHKGEKAEIRAIINDNIGIETAFVEVRYPPDTTYEGTLLTFDGTEWSALITVKSVGVRIHYHFRVTDTSGNVLITEDVERLMLSQRPSIVTVPETEAYENQEYVQDFDADDPDNEDYEHQWRMTTNATWLEIDPVEGTVSGTPGDVHVGWYWVNVTVLDPDGVDDWLYYEVIVNDVNAPPEVSIVSPPDEQKVGTILRVSGRATDDLDTIIWVKVRIDEGEWVEVSGTRTWSYEVSVKDLDPGMHFFTAKSYDGVTESRPDEIAFIVPKKDEPEESPGFGTIVVALALVSALAAAMLTGGRRR